MHWCSRSVRRILNPHTHIHGATTKKTRCSCDLWTWLVNCVWTVWEEMKWEVNKWWIPHYREMMWSLLRSSQIFCTRDIFPFDIFRRHWNECCSIYFLGVSINLLRSLCVVLCFFYLFSFAKLPPKFVECSDQSHISTKQWHHSVP